MTNRPVRLLVSVRTAAEAQSALAGGADIIDIKEPNRGPMGQADATTIQAITATVGSQVPVSAALGDLNISHPPQVLPGLYFVKMGLAQAPTHWQKHLTRAFGRLHPARTVVVAYADAKRTSAPAVDHVLQWAIQHRPAGLLIDTAVKDSSNLFNWLDSVSIRLLIKKTQQANLMIGLAGSLHDAALQHAITLNPDIVAVRGAACGEGIRTSQIQLNRVVDIAKIISTHNQPLDRRAG